MNGTRVYLWSRLERVVAWLRSDGYVRRGYLPNEVLNLDLMRMLRRSLTPWPVDALLSSTQIKFHATDPRDKIYGLLGLAAECQDPSAFPACFQPDYRIDVAQLYQNVARHLLKHTHSLALLTRAHGMNNKLARQHRQLDLTALPSWTPDWSDLHLSDRPIRTSLSWVHYNDGGSSQCARLGFPRHYRAADGRGTVIYPTAGSDTSVLRISGFRIDKVRFVVNLCTDGVVKRAEFVHSFSSHIAHACKAAAPLIRGTDFVS